MDNFRIYNQATAALLALEAAPLLVSPSMAAWMASSEPKTVSAFENLVARELGFALLLCSFLALLFSGELHRLWDDADNVPIASATASSPCGAGLLVLVFANDGKISKRTGADKRTSGFMFKNQAHVQKHS
ncbi:hypothetical protein M436DRAFT_63131 [Aureobasidium namibiae CBS 147.97]|uniref:Uncharacterized protein n=1 Tax=Aureobasidium namibiae CBS 147.97 TaxID=1043004 RepID=A0A074WQA4_9PEZI|nr:uncharacterized protein M436DRAFT_63131 [Aureobasidium namibiae CBS 147.97]KEQ73769.1 hypothetical protein M436DRAFT_63131 [Aureobasidium namibiae CBS 147.97]